MFWLFYYFAICAFLSMSSAWFSRWLPVGVLSAAMGALACAAQVESLSVSFYWGNSPNSQINSEPGDGTAGVVDVDGWVEWSENQLISGSVPISSRSGATLADLSVIGAASDLGVKTYEAATPSGDNEQLMYRGLRSGSAGNSMTINISGLDQTFVTIGFDLIAYLVNTENSQYDGTYSLEVDGIKRYGVVATMFADPFDLGSGFQNAGQSELLAGAGLVNYLRFENLAGHENLQFTIRNESGNRVITQGFQLIAIPEPGPHAFVLLSVVAACLWRGNRTDHLLGFTGRLRRRR